MKKMLVLSLALGLVLGAMTCAQTILAGIFEDDVAQITSDTSLAAGEAEDAFDMGMAASVVRDDIRALDAEFSHPSPGVVVVSYDNVILSKPGQARSVTLNGSKTMTFMDVTGTPTDDKNSVSTIRVWLNGLQRSFSNLTMTISSTVTGTRYISGSLFKGDTGTVYFDAQNVVHEGTYTGPNRESSYTHTVLENHMAYLRPLRSGGASGYIDGQIETSRRTWEYSVTVYGNGTATLGFTSPVQKEITINVSSGEVKE